MVQEKETKQKDKDPEMFGSWEELREKWAKAQRGI